MYDNLLYEAYGYQLDESDIKLRTVVRKLNANLADSRLWREAFREASKMGLHLSIRRGLITAFNEAGRRLVSVSEQIPNHFPLTNEYLEYLISKDAPGVDRDDPNDDKRAIANYLRASKQVILRFQDASDPWLPDEIAMSVLRYKFPTHSVITVSH